MRLKIVLCLILCGGCSQHAGWSLEELALTAERNGEHGDLPSAFATAIRGERLSSYSPNPIWKWRFRCTQAEVLILRREWSNAARILEGNATADLRDSETAVRLQIDRGVANVWLGNLAAARANFNSAAELSKIPRNSRWLGELKRREALLAYVTEHRTDAEEFSRQAIAFARKNNQPILEANAMAFLGAILTNARRWSEAVDWLQSAINLSRKVLVKTVLEQALGNVGWCYYNLGDPDSALKSLTEADRVAEDIGLLDERRRWLTNVGLIFEDRDDFAKASAFHSRALQFARQGNQAAAIATCLHNLAINAFNRDDFKTAEEYNREEMRLKQTGGNRGAELYGRYLEGHIQGQRHNYDEAVAIFNKVAVESGDDLSLRWQAQVSAAHVNVARNRPELAQEEFESALTTISVGRQRVGRDDFKLSYRAGRNRYYSDYIQFLMGQRRPFEALAVAETSRAQVLSERLGVTTRANFTLAHVQAAAAALKGVVLSYWLTPETSYLWVITPTEFAAITLPPSREITELAELHRRMIMSSTQQGDTRLFDVLVAPAKKYMRTGSRVVIVPDASLFEVNFETLLVPGEPHPHYWIDDATVSTATSLALLAPRSRAKGRGNILLIGNPVSARPEFPALPYSGTELRSIADRFPSNQRVTFEGDQARPSVYGLASPGSFAWIHFAAHGIASKESPLDSAIILSKEGDSYKLYARDIAAVPLKADLVTISACYGSGSRTYAGEGIVGLAWAFLLAGAHNVVASLWEANDYYTARLMDKMYERLKAGDEPAYALRTAKLTLLHSPYVCRNPRYWGAFQLYTGY